MSSDLLLLIVLVLVVLLGSALCSGVEAALLTVNPIRVQELAARESPVAGARRLAKLRKHLGRTLSALVITNNGFNIFGSLMLGGYAAWVFEQRGVNSAALPLFSIGLTILVILLGEILPKALGSRLALPVALASAPLLHWKEFCYARLWFSWSESCRPSPRKPRSAPTKTKSGSSLALAPKKEKSKRMKPR